MPCRLVGVPELCVVEYTGMMLSNARFIEHLCYPVNLLLLNLPLQNDNCIFEVTTLYQSHPEQRFQLMEEDECAVSCYLLLKLIYMVKDGILVAKDL